MALEMLSHRTITITHELVTAASLLVRIAHSDDASLARALGKAEQRLFDLAWVVADGELHIASYSRPRDINVTDGCECTCPTSRGRCWHIASWMVLSTICAAGINPVAPLPLPSVLDEDELPAESFLDGDFDSFDDDTLLGHDEYGDIIPRPAPAFIECDSSMPLLKRGPAPFRLQPSRVIPNPLDADVDALFEPVKYPRRGNPRVKEVA